MTSVQLIQSVVLSSDTATVTFGTGNTIPQEFTDLKLVIMGRRNNTSTPQSYPYLQVNSSNATYSYRRMYGFNSAVYSNNASSQTNYAFHPSGLPTSAEAFALFTIDIFSYANPSVPKSMVTEIAAPQINGSNYIAGKSGGVWRTNDAITLITVNAGGASWHTGSSFYLWGVK